MILTIGNSRQNVQALGNPAILEFSGPTKRERPLAVLKGELNGDLGKMMISLTGAMVQARKRLKHRPAVWS